MNLFKQFRDIVITELDALAAEGRLPHGLNSARVSVDPPREAGHGDLTTNAAMVLARDAKIESARYRRIAGRKADE